MGGAKRMWEEANERGFFVDENLIVCSNCFEDYAIKKFIEDHNSEQPCDFCEDQDGASCTLEEVLVHIMTCLKYEWGHPANEGLPYESREGGWQGDVIDTWEMLENTGIEINSEELQDIIYSSLINNEWCKRNPYSLTEDRVFYYGWMEFSKFVMHEARYVFLSATPSTYDENQHDEMHPVKILEVLSQITENLGLIRKIDASTGIYRVRIVNLNETLNSASELGAPPLEFATIPNRISPAGISMFYGAFDISTAIIETYDASKPADKKAIVGKFHPARALRVLDLSHVPPKPSLFDMERLHERTWIAFLNDFIYDLSRPIDRDDRSHIEYVPTQIVTEYFRHIVRIEEQFKVDGIIYPSAKNPGHSAIVIFAQNKHCIDMASAYSEDAMLFLEAVTEERL